MISVVHISASITGGAGIAAYRLHRSMLASGSFKSTFICQNAGRHIGEEHVVKLGTRSLTIFQRVLRKINMFPDGMASFNKKLRGMTGHYEIATWPETNYRIELEAAVQQADIVHLHWVAGFLNYPTFFAKLSGKCIVWTIHDMNPFMGIFHYQGDQDRNPAFRELDKRASDIKSRALTGVKNLCVIALSQWIGAEAKKNPVFREFEFKSIANGIDLEVFHPVSKKLARARLRLTNEEYVLLFVSENLDNYRKGIDLLIGSLSLLKTKVPVRLVSVGAGSVALPENVSYTSFGQVASEEKLADIYASADAFVITSREDNLPNVMVEAMACGTPVLGFPIGGQKEYILPFETGVLATEVTAAAFATAIDEFLENRNRFDQAKIAAFAKLHFDRMKQVTAHVNLYKELLDKGVN